MLTPVLVWGGVALAILLLIMLVVLGIAWRARRTEWSRRDRQLDSVYNSRMRRERGV